jgi:hypothetical protein
MKRSIDVQGPRYRNTGSTKNSVLPSFPAQYTCRTQEGLTKKVTLPVYTARNGEETKKKQKKRKREGGLQCTMSADTKEQRSCWDFPRISASYYCSKSLPPALFNANLPQE